MDECVHDDQRQDAEDRILVHRLKTAEYEERAALLRCAVAEMEYEQRKAHADALQRHTERLNLITLIDSRGLAVS